MPLMERDSCVNPIVGDVGQLEMRDASKPRGITRRQVTETGGYTTTDDFGTDGERHPLLAKALSLCVDAKTDSIWRGR